MKELKVKTWIIDKAKDQAARYNIFIDYSRREENGSRVEEDGCVYVIAEQLSETEKAVRVRLSSGLVVGSSKGWELWIPKSQIMN